MACWLGYKYFEIVGSLEEVSAGHKDGNLLLPGKRENIPIKGDFKSSGMLSSEVTYWTAVRLEI